jgi:hypothetical protein
MATTTMNAMNGPLTGARFSLPTLAMTKFLQQRAALPDMPEQDTHLAAFTGIALRLAAAAVPATGMAWLCLAG